VLAAWGFTAEGRKVLLALMAGSKEDAETVSAFFQDMRGRGLGDPLLVASDGAPGIVKAIKTCFPRSARQRRLAHRMRNLATKVPEDLWPDFKAGAQAAYQAPSRAIARDLADGLVADYEKALPSAVACFQDDTRIEPEHRLSRPASPTCACRSPIGGRPGRQTCLSACSSRSASVSRLIPDNNRGSSPTPSARSPSSSSCSPP